MTDNGIQVTEIVTRSSNGYNYIKGRVFSTENPTFAVQILHGVTEHMGRYTEFARCMCDNLNCAVIIYDQCGHGASVIDKSDYGYFASRRGYKHIVRDAHGFLEEAKKITGNIPVFLLGYDMGSLIARESITRHPSDYVGLILIGTCYKSFAMRMLLKKCQNAISDNSESYLSAKLYKEYVFGRSKNFDGETDNDWLNSDEEELNKYLNDPLCNFSLSVSGIKDIIKLRISVNESKWFKDMPDIPILILSGTDDPVCNFSKHSLIIANRLRMCDKSDVSTITYPSARHDLLHETCKTQVYKDIANWIIIRM
ncbi:MAG: alpha/beta hydrolase [Clostridia bacterium]|nr:alpha/beta hydrolase [Clostridia bacterium]